MEQSDLGFSNSATVKGSEPLTDDHLLSKSKS